jgi:hypothetical protein
MNFQKLLQVTNDTVSLLTQDKMCSRHEKSQSCNLSLSCHAIMSSSKTRDLPVGHLQFSRSLQTQILYTHTKKTQMLGNIQGCILVIDSIITHFNPATDSNSHSEHERTTNKH